MSSTSDIRRFGAVAFLFFGLLSAIGSVKGKIIAAAFFGFLSILGAGFLISPERTRPVYNVWIKIAHLIGKSFTALLLVLAYFLVITPSALVKRVFGGRPLPIRPDKDLASYWHPREEPLQPIERYKKRF